MTTDPRVDAYIDRAAEFARPMLAQLREQAHAVCPEAEEAIKWGMPTLVWRGKNLCGLAAFKAHVAFIVHGETSGGKTEGMGDFGKMQSLADLPAKADLTRLLKARMKAIEAGPKPAATSKPSKLPPDVPADLAAALKGTVAAEVTFKAFSPSNKRDYVEWIAEAKREDTRVRRIEQAVAWMAEGKPRNWKYMK